PRRRPRSDPASALRPCPLRPPRRPPGAAAGWMRPPPPRGVRAVRGAARPETPPALRAAPASLPLAPPEARPGRVEVRWPACPRGSSLRKAPCPLRERRWSALRAHWALQAYWARRLLRERLQREVGFRAKLPRAAPWRSARAPQAADPVPAWMVPWG